MADVDQGEVPSGGEFDIEGSLRGTIRSLAEVVAEFRMKERFGEIDDGQRTRIATLAEEGLGYIAQLGVTLPEAEPDASDRVERPTPPGSFQFEGVTFSFDDERSVISAMARAEGTETITLWDDDSPVDYDISTCSRQHQAFFALAAAISDQSPGYVLSVAKQRLFFAHRPDTARLGPREVHRAVSMPHHPLHEVFIFEKLPHSRSYSAGFKRPSQQPHEGRYFRANGPNGLFTEDAA